MHDSDELASAFIELEGIVRGSTRLPGLAAARVEARRRAGRRVAWVAAAMVFLVAVGVTTVSLGWLRRGGPPVVGPSPSITANPTSTPSITATPTPTITGSSAVLADLALPARIGNAALDVPAFDLAGCPSGDLEFVDGKIISSGLLAVQMEVAAVGDVDADGLEDTVVALMCPINGLHSPVGFQVVAYSGPELTLLGPVPTGGLTSVTSLLVRPNGDVELAMAQTAPQRGIVFARYHWTGSGFDLIEDVDVAEDALPLVVVSAEPAVIALAPGGPAKTFAVTVRNDGPTSLLPLQLIVVSTAPVSIEVERFASTPAGSRRDLLISAPAAGETVTIPLRVALPANATLQGSATAPVVSPQIQVSVNGNRASAPDSDHFTITLQPA